MSQVNDCMLAHYKSHGATSNNINDAEYEFLIAQGATPGQVNDMWVHVLKGPFIDLIAPYWKAHGCKEHDGGGAHPLMSSNRVLQSFVEDGVPGTILAEYLDPLIFPAAGFNLAAVTVMINGVKATVLGFGEDLGGTPDVAIEITFSPDAKHGDIVTWQYDARVDPTFTEFDPPKHPINFALNQAGNQIAADAPVTIELDTLADYLVGDGWDATAQMVPPYGINVENPSGTTTFYPEDMLLSCDLSTIHPTPLHNDFCDGLKEQGLCVGTNCP